ncbi:MAG: hypothetical protein ACO1RT_19150 [Planctomycetaceae bacterium]
MMRFTNVVMGWLVFLGMSNLQVCSANEPRIYRIEEDWELVINEPDAASNSPQVTFSTYPDAGLDGHCFQLQMNYAADTEFSAGGFHVAAVKNDSMVDEARSQTRSVLSTNGDRIRWTSIMAVIDGDALYAIKDGFGTQWGSFGGPEYLVRMYSTPTADLSGYTPQKSLDAVDIGFGANRINSITLRQVRSYYTDGRVETVAVNQNP